MSSCNYGCYADTVKPEFIKEQCPKEYEAFAIASMNAKVSLKEFFAAKHFEDEYPTDEVHQELIESAWETLQKAFNEKTGLELGVVYHDAEERSDDLNGGAFSVDGVYGYTPAGEKFKQHIERLNWTTFG